MFNLFAHMNAGINSLLLDAVKVSLRKPAQLKFLRAFLGNLGTAQRKREELGKQGLNVPPFLIASITTNCNLFCTGCYSRANNESCHTSGTQGRPLDTARWEKLFQEAEEMGVCFILLAGGEPMLRFDVLEAAGKYPGIIFPIFTNGTLIDDRMMSYLETHRNLIPVISLEGNREETDSRRGIGVYDKVTDMMAEMQARKVFFGTSVTVTRSNLGLVTDPGFVKGMKKSGCSLVFYVEYVPADQVSRPLALTGQDRIILEKSVQALKETSGMLVISFPGDEKETGGCLAAGRGFVHINMDGSVEPCPFSPYSDTNLANITLMEALQSPFLSKMREDGFLLGEHSGGCLLFEKQEEVRSMLGDAKTI